MNHKIISFWSKVGHKNGITTHTYLFAFMLAELFPDKNILTIDTNFKFAILEKLMNTKHNKNLDTALNLCTMGGLTKETFCECIVPVKIKTNNLYNLNASQNNVYNNIYEKSKGMQQVIDIAKDIFDFTIIDNAAGDNDISTHINSRADVVMNFMKQEIYTINYLKENHYIDEIRKEEKYFNIINEYNENRGIALSSIKKDLEMENVDYIPFLEEVIFCMNNDDLKQVLKNKDTDYCRQLRTILGKILKMMNIGDVVIDGGEEKNKPVFSLFPKLIRKL